jgi:hypothetical protein
MSSTEPSEESALGPFSTENVTQAGGVEDNESITAAFQFRQPGEVRIFTGLAQSLEVFREPLPASVARYHEAYILKDPTQEDVLVEFGAVSGELPNTDPAQTAALRVALIRYDKPHCLFKWEYLGSLIEEVVQLNAKYLPCFPFTNPAFSKQLFCLGLEPLSHIAYAVIAVQQILEALTIFLGKDPLTSFTLDPDYRLLGLLERSAHEAELRFTVTSLQQRLSNGNKHILSYFHSIRRRGLERYQQLCRLHVAQDMSRVRDTKPDAGNVSPPAATRLRLVGRDDQ